ncbi:MAG: 4,5-dihydroxyphthalate decarboxylase [Alphaproteobacteria bacterium]|jgi:4,5-dihydroxyphthalate decarboxylase|nr:4,5-dihydroxyphthalate decarboxylase [Alphaproteobacteria bacterium]
MARLSLTVATWDYDRVRALIDGRVRVEGCDINYIVLPAEECFHRAYLHSEFEVAEIGFGPYLIGLSRGTVPYVAVPAFLSRAFRHSAIYVRDDRGIEGPADLRGRRVGVPEYQMSAVTWIRGFLKDEFGIAAGDIQWVQGGLEESGRRDKFPINIPAGFPLTAAPEGKPISQLLAEGEIDAIFSARAPSTFLNRHPRVRRLFADYRGAERDYFRRTGLFPIMHAVGIRRDLAERHPWLPASVYKAFSQAKQIADADLREVVALKIGLPWIGAELEATEAAMGRDFWPYGVAANRKTLEALARYSNEQHLAVRRLTVEEMFAATTLDETKV